MTTISTTLYQGLNPLFNPDILGQVASFLPTEEMNVIREVCSQWKKDWSQVVAKNLDHNKDYIDYKTNKQKAIDEYNKFYRSLELIKPSVFSFIMPVVVVIVNAPLFLIPAILVYPVVAISVIIKRIFKPTAGRLSGIVRETTKLTCKVLNYISTKKFFLKGLNDFRYLLQKRKGIKEKLKILQKRRLNAKKPQEIDYYDLRFPIGYYPIVF